MYHTNHRQQFVLSCHYFPVSEACVTHCVFDALRLLDQDLHSACLAADPAMDWHRLPFVIEVLLLVPGGCHHHESTFGAKITH